MFLKSIKNIKIVNGDIAVFRHLNIKACDIELQISKYNFSGSGREKNSIVENTLFPPFIQVFYYLFYYRLRIPTEDEFCDTYFEWLGASANEESINIEGVDYPVYDLKSRMLRTYPSLIRDLHLYYLLIESEHFSNVEYSLRADYFDGLDVEVMYGIKKYFLSVYIKTRRGEKYKEKKSRRHDYNKVKELRLGVEFSSLKKVGQFYLLQEAHVDNILEIMHKDRDGKNEVHHLDS